MRLRSLDYLPPFEGAPGFCTPVSAQDEDDAVWGCCTKADHASVQDSVKRGVQGTSDAAAKCTTFQKKVACSQCHPYAAHIFDAESADGYARPGLTVEYCKE